MTSPDAAKPHQRRSSEIDRSSEAVPCIRPATCQQFWRNASPRRAVLDQGPTTTRLRSRRNGDALRAWPMEYQNWGRRGRGYERTDKGQSSPRRRDIISFRPDPWTRSEGRARRPFASQASTSNSALSPARQRISSSCHRARPTPGTGNGVEGRALTRQRVTAAVGCPKSVASICRRQRRMAMPIAPDPSAAS